MNAASLYSGPAKIYYNALGLFAQGEMGELKIDFQVESDPVASALQGRIDETQGDVIVSVPFTPFDRWATLATLFPAAITTPAIGTRFAGASNTLTKVWAPDQRLFTIQNTFVRKHPDIHLGVGKPLFGAAEIAGCIKDGTEIPTANCFVQAQTGQADPGGQFAMTDFIREKWTGVWGTVAGFGGDGSSSPVEAEEEWIINFSVKYNPKKVQKLTRFWELASVAVMARCRPAGPTQANILAALAIQDSPGILGRRYGAGGSTLTLTSNQSAKTITIYNANLKTAGFEFGGVKLGNGEIGFVTGATFTAGAFQPLIAFSA